MTDCPDKRIPLLLKRLNHATCRAFIAIKISDRQSEKYILSYDAEKWQQLGIPSLDQVVRGHFAAISVKTQDFCLISMLQPTWNNRTIPATNPALDVVLVH